MPALIKPARQNQVFCTTVDRNGGWQSQLRLSSTISSKPNGLAGIQIDGNAATGDFLLSLSPANLTAARRWSFPDRSDTVAGLGAQTFTGIQLITDSTASTSTTTGAIVVTGGIGCGGSLTLGNDASGVSVRSPSFVLRSTLGGVAGNIYMDVAAGSASHGELIVRSSNGFTERLKISAAGVVTCQGSLEVNSATLIKSNTTLTDGAAAAVGTLTNAPTAGNPTKWVLINDNGTIRKFPTWT